MEEKESWGTFFNSQHFKGGGGGGVGGHVGAPRWD